MMKFPGRLKTIHIGLLLAFIYLVCGLSVLDDFGISYDEETQRIKNGIPNVEYMTGEDCETLLASNEKYHGPVFEMLLVVAERALGSDDTRQVFLLRHLINFLTFYSSIIVMFLLGRGCFNSDRWGLFAALMYALSPRFFAESFYNSKDIIFLALVTFSLYTLYRFSKNVNLKWAFIHALVAGIMFDVRVIGLFIPVCTVGLVLYQYFLEEKHQQGLTGIFATLAFYLGMQTLVVIAFWPILWEGPVHHFVQAIRQMSSYNWVGDMRFMGELVVSNDLPWYYLPTWIISTIPTLNLLLAITGVLVSLGAFVPLNRKTLLKYRFDHLFLAVMITPPLLIILMGSVVLDGWRHFYFLYAPMVLLATRGAMVIWARLSALVPPRFSNTVMVGFFLSVFLWPVYAIVSYHPFQYVYFNALAKTFFAPLEKSFEMDYWGLSYRQALEYLLETEGQNDIRLKPAETPGYDNRLMLNPVERNRLKYQEEFYGPGTYLLTAGRGRLGTALRVRSDLVHTITTPSGPILSIYRTVDSLHIKQIIRHAFWDFEEENDTIRFVNDAKAPSGNKVNKVGGGWDYGKALQFTVDSIPAKGLLGVRGTGWLKSEGPLPDLLFVISADRNGKNVLWGGRDVSYMFNRGDAWEQWSWALTLGRAELQPGDEVSLFFWSTDGDVTYQDDVDISLLIYEDNEAYHPDE